MFMNTGPEGIILIISGLYYFKENMIFGIMNLLLTVPVVIIELGDEAAHMILLLIFTTIYNQIDQKNHSVCELENFRNLTKIERRSLHLTQFVNRLLPKHVRNLILILNQC
jgi:hypothetical protein